MRCLTVRGRDIFDDAPVTVLTHDSLARLAGEPLIEAFLNALNPLAVDVGKANEVSGYFAGWVVTAGFFTQMNTRQLQFANVVRHVRVNLTRQIDKTSFRVRVNAGSQLIQRHFQRIREGFPAVIKGNATGVVQLFRIGPDRFHRHAHRQRTTGAVGDHPAGRGNLLNAQRAHIALAYQHVRGDDLQPGHAAQ